MQADDINQKREKLLEIILKEAYFKGKITLSSGKESDYYIDARRITLKPEGAVLCGSLILDVLKDDIYDAIGGPTLGADPLIGAIGTLGFQAGKSFNTFIIRKSAKSHGKQQQVEGPILVEGSKVIIIDDVATTGKAFLQSFDVLKAMGVLVDKAICIVDRQDGAKEALAEKGCELISLFDISEIHK